jgi:hypothetical protein
MAQIPSNHMQAFILGMLNGQFMKWQAEYENGNGMVKITNVVPEVDDEGNYLNVINVTLESGIVLQIRVDELTQINEEP